MVVVESLKIMSTCWVLITTSKQMGDGCFVKETMYKKILTQLGDSACATTRDVFPESCTKERTLYLWLCIMLKMETELFDRGKITRQRLLKDRVCVNEGKCLI